jgi:hypothetical protein
VWAARFSESAQNQTLEIYSTTILVRGPRRDSIRRKALSSSATQPAVGAKPFLAAWMNTALPRPATRGRVL